MTLGDESAKTRPVQSRSDYLDRLGQSEPLESWQFDELTAALAVVDAVNAETRRPPGEPQVIDIRLMIYRRRVQYELERRTSPEHDPFEH